MQQVRAMGPDDLTRHCKRAVDIKGDDKENDAGGSKSEWALKRRFGAQNSNYDAKRKEAAVGFEPTNNGFANRRLRPLGYAALLFHVLILKGFTSHLGCLAFFIIQP